jgi:hypothetical protein
MVAVQTEASARGNSKTFAVHPGTEVNRAQLDRMALPIVECGTSDGLCTRLGDDEDGESFGKLCLAAIKIGQLALN